MGFSGRFFGDFWFSTNISNINFHGLSHWPSISSLKKAPKFPPKSAQISIALQLSTQ
jgi:hypothetical protein